MKRFDRLWCELKGIREALDFMTDFGCGCGESETLGKVNFLLARQDELHVDGKKRMERNSAELASLIEERFRDLARRQEKRFNRIHDFFIDLATSLNELGVETPHPPCLCNDCRHWSI